MSEGKNTCSKTWSIQSHEIVGRGGHRSVYRACKSGTTECSFVAKIGRIRTAEEWDQIRNENEVGKSLHALGMGPKIEELLFCDLHLKEGKTDFWPFFDEKSYKQKDENTFFALLEEEPFWDSELCKDEKCTFYIFITSYVKGPTARQYLNSLPQDKPLMMAKILFLVKQMFEHGLVAADPNFDNFILTEGNKLVLIDTEHVYPLGSQLLRKFEIHQQTDLHTLDQVIDYADFVMQVV